MKTSSLKINLFSKYASRFDALKRYRVLGFVLVVAVLYGFVLMRINTLGSVEPMDDAVAEQVKAARVPHINETVVEQLESLEDNSVSVKTLFNEARSNPFQ